MGRITNRKGRKAEEDAGMSDEIKPCPFCGGEAEYDDHKSDFYGLDMPGVECKSRDCNLVRNWAGSKQDAIAQWNKRAAPWQPIDTAPKDKDILVFVSDGDESYVDIANWQEYYPRGFYWAHARCVDGLHVGGNVTHWMPLPEPPK